jgi:amidase
MFSKNQFSIKMFLKPPVSLMMIFPLLWSCSFTDQESGMLKNDIEIIEIDIERLQKGYANREFSIQEITKIYLDRINELDFNGPKLNSIIQVNPDALKIALELDNELSNGKIRGPLHGIPIVLKDNIDTHDKMNTTAGSLALKNSKPQQDSYIANKLREAGAVILAKSNLSEWANFRGQKSSSGWSAINGQTKNPYVLSHNPCGSSSGSGVAVSANLTVLAIGTETNGSIVCPSSANGIVGIKPTVGLISRSGIIPISFTQDTPGPMARNVTDAVIALGALSGIDPQDKMTLKSQDYGLKDYTPYLKSNGIEGKRIGLFKAPLGKNAKVDSLLYHSIQLIKDAGGIIIEIDEITPAETAKNSFEVMLYEYKYGLNEYFASLGKNAPVKSLSELIEFNKKDSLELKYFNQAYLEMAEGKGDLSDMEYKTALANLVRMSQKLGIDRVVEENKLDAIIAPTGSPAWETDLINGDNYYLGSSSPAAWAGYPNITLPMGNIDGLPVGLSIFGKAWSEPALIEIAFDFEQRSKARIIPSFQVN